MTRKDFLKRLASGLGGIATIGAAGELLTRPRAFALTGPAHPARFWRRLDETTVQCELCPRGCTLADGQRSFCRVREARAGALYTAAYGAVAAAHIDPIEKKPLFHFLPGTSAYSIATAGCNYRCKSCQNWQISQTTPEESASEPATPAEIVERAARAGCPTIAHTYTEPVIFYEYMFDIAAIARQRRLRTMCHSNGSFTPAALAALLPYLDAANIDLKGFSQDFYGDFAAGYLDQTLKNLVTLQQHKVWLEITNLIIPSLNDDLVMIDRMCRWIVAELGPDVPLHFSRFWPHYKLTQLPATPVETLEKAYRIARNAGIHYVYIGNLPVSAGEHTYCHGCNRILIRRSGYTILENRLVNGVCPSCSTKIPGVWH